MSPASYIVTFALTGFVLGVIVESFALAYGWPGWLEYGLLGLVALVAGSIAFVLPRYVVRS